MRPTVRQMCSWRLEVLGQYYWSSYSNGRTFMYYIRYHTVTYCINLYKHILLVILLRSLHPWPWHWLAVESLPSSSGWQPWTVPLTLGSLGGISQDVKVWVPWLKTSGLFFPPACGFWMILGILLFWMFSHSWEECQIYLCPKLALVPRVEQLKSWKSVYVALQEGFRGH